MKFALNSLTIINEKNSMINKKVYYIMYIYILKKKKKKIKIKTFFYPN